MSDPQIFQAAATDGKMRHTFTGLNKAFPNVSIHEVIRDVVLPGRKELTRRPEFQSSTPWDDNICLFVHELLTAWSERIKAITYKPTQLPGTTLAERQQAQRDFIKKAHGDSLETLAKDQAASHADQLLPTANPLSLTLTFDHTGADPDFPQPTPGRFADAMARSLITGMDLLVVEMTVSPSADHPRTVNVQDSARWLSSLADLWNLTDAAAQDRKPYIPTGVDRSQYDRLWNAAGQSDPNLSDGNQNNPSTIQQERTQSDSGRVNTGRN